MKRKLIGTEVNIDGKEGDIKLVGVEMEYER